MKIKVERTGGTAAVPRVWTVDARTDAALSQWQPLVEACPWDAVPRTPRAAAAALEAPQPDRFIYSITAGQRRAALPEQAITGPWRVLVDSARAAAEETAAVLPPGTNTGPTS
ncbi:protealysin inhibitor emfourin [Arthrobacter sp. SLBN-53]|uniref:protealysin inhibitor emfourin n=1 Tax=unclassified Pseudarthrobacter TaxID=2647000 RepID=UPI0011544888